MDDNITRRHLKRHQDSLEDEKVPTSRKAKRFVDVTTRKTDERRRDGQVGHHLRHAEGDGQDDRAPHGESDEETRWAAVEEATADLDVEGCADGASDAKGCELVGFLSWEKHRTRSGTDPMSWMCLAFNFRWVLSCTPEMLAASDP